MVPFGFLFCVGVVVRPALRLAKLKKEEQQEASRWFPSQSASLERAKEASVLVLKFVVMLVLLVASYAGVADFVSSSPLIGIVWGFSPASPSRFPIT